MSAVVFYIWLQHPLKLVMEVNILDGMRNSGVHSGKRTILKA
jgi:hypothetical protein